MQKILLHVCCGICELSAIKRLKDLNYEVISYFFNPNIWPYDEYKKRLDVFLKVSKHFGIQYLYEDLSEEQYYEEHKKWQKYLFSNVGNPANYTEGQERCFFCIEYRLNRVAQIAKKRVINLISTSLSSGPKKNINMINEIGNKVANAYKLQFLPEIFRKNNGWNYSIMMSKELNLYRQHYCGCEYSLIERKKQTMKNQNNC